MKFTASKSIVARTPNRIDLSGGTLDIYPLYVFEGGSLTVNIAVQVYSVAEIETRSDSKLSFHSKDLKKELEFAHLEACVLEGELDLLIRAVKHYPPLSGIRLTTENQAPHGSGLGASSALLMAVSAVLNHHNETNFSIQEMIDIGANLEAQTIRIPTGKQDYLAAMHGGINLLWFSEPGIKVEPVPYTEKEIEELESRFILSYTGIPHFSGDNNWSIMKRYIDGEPETVNALRRIKATSLNMRDAVLKRNWNQIADLLNEEWENRKRLSAGVTTEQVDRLMAAAVKAGAKANKLCGAGGGGCMITWVDPKDRDNVEKALSLGGAKLLPFKVALKGLEITNLKESHTL